MALGWGLWEGPARFIFWDPRFFKSGRSLLPTVPDNIAPLDFPKKWHNIPRDDELELARLSINEATGHPSLGGRFATVAALPRARCGIFRAAINEWVCCRDEKWPH